MQQVKHFYPNYKRSKVYLLFLYNCIKCIDILFFYYVKCYTIIIKISVNYVLTANTNLSLWVRSETSCHMFCSVITMINIAEQPVMKLEDISIGRILLRINLFLFNPSSSLYPGGSQEHCEIGRNTPWMVQQSSARHHAHTYGYTQSLIKSQSTYSPEPRIEPGSMMYAAVSFYLQLLHSKYSYCEIFFWTVVCKIDQYHVFCVWRTLKASWLV